MCSGNGNITDSECQCTFQTSRLAVFDENAASCDGDSWYPGAKTAQQDTKDTTCCHYLDAFAVIEYAQAIDDVPDRDVVSKYCQEWNEAYENIEAKFSVCTIEARQMSAIKNTTDQCAQEGDNAVCCPDGRCPMAIAV